MNLEDLQKEVLKSKTTKIYPIGTKIYRVLDDGFCRLLLAVLQWYPMPQELKDEVLGSIDEILKLENKRLNELVTQSGDNQDV